MSTSDTMSSIFNEPTGEKPSKSLDTHGANYGGVPLTQAHTTRTIFGNEAHSSLPYKIEVERRKFANPAPLGLSAFALTTFVLSLINLHARNVSGPSIVLALAYAYGGLVQLLAGMWEMAVGNTFGATALSSYGGFWIAYAILLTPGFQALEGSYDESDEASVVGFFLAGWFIFTTILLLCTLRSTVMFFLLFFTLDLAFLMLFSSEFAKSNGSPEMALRLQQAGGGFGLTAALFAWYNALAGIADVSNSFFPIPVFHFPWSEHYRATCRKTPRETV